MLTAELKMEYCKKLTRVPPLTFQCKSRRAIKPRTETHKVAVAREKLAILSAVMTTSTNVVGSMFPIPITNRASVEIKAMGIKYARRWLARSKEDQPFTAPRTARIASTV